MKSVAVAMIGLAFAGTALAGDFATLEPIGFSAEGRVFAFEQYGVQDGSGFPYAQIVFVDLDTDRQIALSPVAIRLEEDGATVAGARAAAREQAQTLLARYAPDPANGRLVAANPPTEVSADPHYVAFRIRPVEPPIDPVVELRLSLTPVADPEPICEEMGETVHGFRLDRFIAEGGGGREGLIHADETIPASRNCPFDYRITQVHVWDGEPARAVAIVGVKQIGFEGPDMRYIALPVPLD